MKTAVWWIRRDLRLADNQALAAAMKAADRVVPLFVLDPALLESENVGPKRIAFLFGGLRSLDSDLRARGSRLIVRRGRPGEVLAAICRQSEATSIFAEADVSPFARARDERVGRQLPLSLVPGLTVHPLDAVLKRDGDPYVVFTPYSRTWMALPPPTEADLVAAPARMEPPPDLESETLPAEPSLPPAADLAPGEQEAQRRLGSFVTGGMAGYADGRDRMDLDGTSQLSPYLRFGMLSARQATVTARAAAQRAGTKPARSGADAWLRQLIWREFYLSILAHFPHVRAGSFRSKYDRIEWRNDETEFDAWCHGRTGYPVVDAAMRQLQATGWMHNRARMIVASFLVKDLLIDWRWGERWFMQHLLDGDPAANNGGWQWTAGTGTDAAPYFRVFNPTLQAEKFDPHGDFVRRWLPELEAVPEKKVHKPWTLTLDEQKEVDCVIGQDYPAPIVDHAAARERALAAYAAVKDD